MNWQKLQYGLNGLLRRGRQKRICPSCNSQTSEIVDEKGFHKLLRCGVCELLYRWPYETQAEMDRFYQRKYQQAGLTTDLPDRTTLDNLVATGFHGSEKDFSPIVTMLKVLSLPPKSKILDFGANWGYGVWQFRKAGFSAIGYELSKPRAEFSGNLGVKVFTDWSKIENRAPFDVVFSSHVLEHTPNPAQALQQKMAILSPGGWLIAIFPNGSEKFKMADPASFHRLWGRVHPVMLNENFIRKILPGSSIAIGSYCQEEIEGLERWDRETTYLGKLNTGEMLIAYRSP